MQQKQQKDTAQKPRSMPHVREHLTAGTIGGLAATVLLYPLDLIKVRYQVSNSGSAYSGVVSGLGKIVRTEGFLALYQGVGVAALSASMAWGGYFFLYELAKKRMRANTAVDQRLAAPQHLFAGFQAGAVMVFVTNPLWLIKTRMQLQRKVPGNEQLYKNGVDAALKIIREEGPLALYKGVVPALLLTSNGAVQFMAYEWLKQWWADGHHSQSAVASLAMGAISKVFASTVTYPFQVIKARLQQRYSVSSASAHMSTERYSGVRDCVSKMWRHEGPRGFFKGCIPNALRVAPASAITFLVYEESLKLLRQS